MSTRNTITTIAIAILIAWSSPTSAHAMSIQVTPEEGGVHAGGTTVLKVSIDTDQQEINAMDGTVSFENADVISTSTGGSIFSLWPKAPTVTGDTSILFTGGTPSGVFGRTLRLFTVSITPKNPENSVLVRTTGSRVYLNDGKGTSVSIPDATITLPVLTQNAGTDGLANQIAKDTQPPLPFVIDLGRESSLFDSKYFISFFATDGNSGIEKYEITENGTTTSVFGNTYVLKDQNLRGKVSVTAIDVAGNKHTETLDFAKPARSLTTTLTIIVLALGVVLAGIYFFIIRRK